MPACQPISPDRPETTLTHSRLANDRTTRSPPSPPPPSNTAKTFKSYGSALASQNAKFVFPVASKLTGDAGSFAAVDYSAMTTPDLRLEGTPARALGASLRAFTQPPCVGRGPFVFQKPGFAYRLPHDGSSSSSPPSNFTWSVIADGSGGKKAKALTEAVAPGDAVALWPGLTSFTHNTGCSPVSVVLVTIGDGDALLFPLRAYGEAGPGADGVTRSVGGGGGASDGATWVDAECAARCGVAPAKGEAKGEAKSEAKAAKGG